MFPEERFRSRVVSAAQELGVTTFFLGFKDPDSDQVRRVYRGDQVWLTGCLDCAVTDLKFDIHSANRIVPPPRAER